jgi:TolA-binding protein
MIVSLQKQARFFIATILAALVMVIVSDCFAKEKPHDEWQVRENLVTRLSGELYKIGVLKKELESIQEILLETRDIELLPPEMTRMGEDSLLAFDKRIEIVMKRHQALSQQVDELRPPLIDAIAILREMVVGQPVEDMFQVLDNDDIHRISTMFEIKHYINSLWKDIDVFLAGISASLQIKKNAREETEQGSESEFIEILKANLGLQSEHFSKVLGDIKDSLFMRGSDDQRMKMFQMEIGRIKYYVKSKDVAPVKRKLLRLIDRYQQPRYIDEINKLLVRVYFLQGAFEKVLDTRLLLPNSMALLPDIVLDAVQSLYFLKRSEELWRWGNAVAVKTLEGPSRNMAIWLTMESGLMLGKTDSVVRLASQAVKDSSYALHILHSLGRFYVKANDLAMAQAVFQSALRYRPQKSVDDEALQRISLSLAQLHYERGDYRKALALFFKLLNNEKTFAEALNGISWCYIALNDYQKAEVTIRKLINQAPWSPLAAEALLLNMRRSERAAKDAWEKFLSLASEEQRLIQRKRSLLEKAARDTGLEKSENFKVLISKIDDLMNRFGKENRPSYRDILLHYEKIDRIAKLIDAYYETGSFQEVSFSEKRERLLGKIDSLIIGSKEMGRAAGLSDGLSKSRNDVSAIKSIVLKSKTFAVEAMIDRYRWEREYLDWQKTKAKRILDDIVKNLNNATDTANRAALMVDQKRQNKYMDSLVVEGDKVKDQRRDKLMKRCAEILESPLDGDDEAYVRYHFGEIHYENENERYAQAFAVYEDSMAVFDSLFVLYREGKALQPPKRPIEPRVDHKASRENYSSILRKFPQSIMIPAVHYSQAWCYNDLGMFDSAAALMEKLVKKYPSCQYAPQAWMYIGEYMFDRSKLDLALTAYQAVLKHPESEWFDKALYKLAWTQYRLSNPEKAIGSFLALVDLGEGEGSGKRLLEKESIDYIAISFSETDATGEKGLERATNFVKRFGDKAKGAQILHRLASIFKDQGRFTMAQKTYATLLRMYPENKKSPFVEAELLAVLEKTVSADEANIGKMEFFNKYNKNSAWAKMQDDSVTRSYGDSISCKLFYDASVSYHQLALRKNDSASYAASGENYRQFIANYPLSPLASECNYNLAEILFSMGDYSQAAEEYMGVSKRYPGSKYKETAAWNAIVASQNLLKKEKAVR